MPRGGKRTTNKVKKCVCENCGTQYEFSDIGREPKYCSNECRYEAALQKRGVKLTCAYCGEDFVSLRKDALYCSQECRGKAMTKETHYRTEHILTCAICGKEFKTIYKNRTCCSQECGWKYQGEKAKKYYECQYCGKTFYSRNGFRMKYCSRECSVNALFGTAEKRAERDALLLESRTITTVCAECGEEFQTTNSTRVYCCAECRETALARQSYEKVLEVYVPRSFTCKECGEEITTEYGNKKSVFCCQGCAKRYEHKLRCSTVEHKIQKAEQTRRRKKQLKEQFVECVNYDLLYERDKGVCQICGLPALYDKHADWDWSGSIDHIIPLSRGGEHSMMNCQLSHRICNSIKLDKTDEFVIDWEELSQRDKHWNERYKRGLFLMAEFI